MRIANIEGRPHLVGTDRALQLGVATAGRIDSFDGVLGAWDEVRDLTAGIDVDGDLRSRGFAASDLGPAVPRPAQIIAVGLNYAEHARESGLALPEHPVVFTKFASSLTGADVDVVLPGDTVDWEAELVVVIGRGGRDIPATAGWDAVAGLAVGQDLSDRTVQWRGTPAQFSLGKSLAGFSPVGPWVVGVEEVSAVADRDDLRVTSTLSHLDGSHEVLQDGRTSDLVFTVPELVARLSAAIELRPGDLIFTGTPSGVGMGMTPPRYLTPGQRLTTAIEGVGSITQTFTARGKEARRPA